MSPRQRSAAAVLAGLALAAGCVSNPPSGPAACPASVGEVLPALAVPALPEGDADSGAALYAEHCVGCHSHDLADRRSRLFRGYPRLDCPAYLDRTSDAYLYTVIARGGTAVGRDDAMKAFGEELGTQGVADVIAYLRSGTLP